MPCTVVVGGQWGDEGKAKVVDYISKDADYIVRYQGGANAGHTVVKDGKKYVFHQIPSGMLYPEKTCVIAHGVVLDPIALLNEIKKLERLGSSLDKRLIISDSCHLILPYHKIMDKASEAKNKDKKIGTTGRGIGPCYADKASRVGIRLMDLYESGFKNLLKENIKEKNFLIKKYYKWDKLSVTEIYDEYMEVAENVKKYVCDVPVLLNNAYDEKKSILMEGAQGTGLDIDFGTYPFVTSSYPTSAGACIGTGISPNKIDKIYGIMKAYLTRVGEGPFPTELEDDMGEYLRKTGGEFGATTGRPRRCGWFDGVFGKYSAMINGFDGIVLTKLDVLDDLDEIKICTEYEIDGVKTKEFPKSVAKLNSIKPVYKTLKGWKTKISDVKEYKELPEKAKDYLKFIEDVVGTKVSVLSVGPDRNDTIPIE
jgi:adenylosuccinate synthase